VDVDGVLRKYANYRNGDVDVDALAGGLQLEVANRLGSMLAYVSEDLSEKERAALVAAALRHMDGLELSFAQALARELGG
jgi:hypothetical protein